MNGPIAGTLCVVIAGTIQIIWPFASLGATMMVEGHDTAVADGLAKAVGVKAELAAIDVGLIRTTAFVVGLFFNFFGLPSSGWSRDDPRSDRADRC